MEEKASKSYSSRAAAESREGQAVVITSGGMWLFKITVLLKVLVLQRGWKIYCKSFSHFFAERLTLKVKMLQYSSILKMTENYYRYGNAVPIVDSHLAVVASFVTQD